MVNPITFDAFRFQLLPNSKVIQTTIENPDLTYTELVKPKKLNI